MSNRYLKQLQESIPPCNSALGLSNTLSWSGNNAQARLTNLGQKPQSISEWLLFDGNLGLADCPIYGEGFQMLAQTMGRWSKPESIGRCPDAAVYRITPDPDYHTVHNLLLVDDGTQWLLLAFASCHRFGGEFRLYPDGRLQIVMNSEGLSLDAGASWQSERLLCLVGRDKEALLAELGTQLAKEHNIQGSERPTGWCSWYHYYAEVSEEDIRENLNERNRRFPQLRYVQIDDGYQEFMGDWLHPSARFADGVPALAAEIRAAGCEPALWVAPFIAEPSSRLFREHPDWFVKDRSGAPLAAETVTYGGWRCTPWYVLDGTHPEVQHHLEQVFRTLREEWGIAYFKLDANFWGAIHQGVFADPKATRIEAYRRGMAAVLRGACAGAFLLGCNAPMWPSIGLVQGMRVTDDVERSGSRMRQIAKELFCRSWQGNHLWALDPDCLCLHDLPNQATTAAVYQFHLAAMVASGGMILSGDRLADLTPTQQQQIEKLLMLCAQKAPSAHFNGFDFSRAELRLPEQTLICLFNWEESPKIFALPKGGVDFWSEEPLLSEEIILAPEEGRVIRFSHKQP